MPDLACITLHVRPQHQDTIPAHTGRAVQAWLLDSLRRIDPVLSKAIHDGSQAKPFTTGCLSPAPPGGLLRLHPARTYRLRVTTLHRDLSQIALNALVPAWLAAPIVIHDQPLAVESIDTQTDGYADLLRRYIDLRQLPRVRALLFDAPTFFARTGGGASVLPTPKAIVDSLYGRWKIFGAHVPLEPDLPAWAEAQVAVSSFRLETHSVSFERAGRGTHTGFVGEVALALESKALPYAAQLHALLEYAAFAGIGAKTTMGFGVVTPRVPQHVSYQEQTRWG